MLRSHPVLRSFGPPSTKGGSPRWPIRSAFDENPLRLEAPSPVERGDAGSADAGAASHGRDLDLARAALAGSPEARTEFVQLMTCVPRFLAVINVRFGRPLADDQLEDAVQETLVEIWRRLDSYAGHAALKTWAHRFCQQVLSNRLRSVRLRPRMRGLGGIDAPSGRLPSSLDYEHVHRALEMVDVLGARIVRHRHFDHLTFSEIGQKLGIPASTAKMHHQRALARLREILEPLRKEAGL